MAFAARPNCRRDEVCANAGGNERLRAADDVMVVLANSSRLQSCDVTSATRLGDRERGDLFATDRGNDEALALGGRAEAQDGRQRNSVSPESHRRADGVTFEDHLFVSDDRMGDVTPASAELGGIREPEEPRFRSRVVELARKLAGFLPCVSMRRDVLLREPLLRL